MSEINTEPAGTAGQGEPEPKTGKTFTEDEFNAHTARLRKAEEAKRAKLEQELSSLREAQKTEAERILDAKLKERDQEWESRLTRERIEAKLERRLVERNLPANAAALVKAEQNIESVDDIDSAIENTLKANEWLRPNKQQMQSQGGSPRHATSQAGEPWSTQRVNQYIRENGQIAYRDIAADVEKDRRTGRFLYN